MTLQNAYKFSRRLVKPIALVWLLCQSMLLCAAGVAAQPSLPGSGLSQQSMAEDIGRMDLSTSSSKMHHASGHMVMSHNAHAMNDSYQFGMNDTYQTDMTLLSDHGTEGSHHSMQDNQCCGEKSKSTNAAFASLVPVGALFVVFWLIGLIVRRQSPARWWQSPTVGYHYPRHHLVNCSFLN